MRAGVTPGPTRTSTSPSGYLTHRGSAELRLFPTCTLFIRWRVLSVSHSIPLTQIIRRPPPLRATLCSRVFRLSRPCPGNDNPLIFVLFFAHTFYTNLCCSFSAQAKLTKRAKKTKSAGEPDLPEPEVTVQESPAASAPEATTPMDTAPAATARLPRRRPKLLLSRRPPAQLHQQTTQTW